MGQDSELVLKEEATIKQRREPKTSGQKQDGCGGSTIAGFKHSKNTHTYSEVLCASLCDCTAHSLIQQMYTIDLLTVTGVHTIDLLMVTMMQT